MDLDTGAFLYSKNAEAKLYPASITKIMTMLVALEHISDSDLDTKVKASESALAPIDSDSSQIWLSVGEKITVRSALYAIMLASANDAANVIARSWKTPRRICGSCIRCPASMRSPWRWTRTPVPATSSRPRTAATSAWR